MAKGVKRAATKLAKLYPKQHIERLKHERRMMAQKHKRRLARHRGWDLSTRILTTRILTRILRVLRARPPFLRARPPFAAV